MYKPHGPELKNTTMKYFMPLLFLLLFSCSDNEFPKAENALDAAREFLDGTLKGDFRKSAAYLPQDDKHKEALDIIKQKYYSYNDQQRQDYRAASLIILKERPVTENESVIYYKNSFDGAADSIKVRNMQGAWLVELR